MKKLCFLFIPVLLLLVFSCKKDEETKTITESPGKVAIQSKLVVDTVGIFNNGSFEFGQKIYFSRNGKITQLGCLMPSKGNFRVSLWDFTSKDLIVATQVTITDTTTFTYADIADISVTASTRYVISINNTSGGTNKPYYKAYKKPISGSSIYPFTSKSITYESNQYKVSNVSVFPDLVDVLTDYYGGIPDVVFEYEE